MSRTAKLVAGVVAALLLLALAFVTGRRSVSPVEVERHDTVTVVRVDTLPVDRPVVVYRRTVDTMLLAVHDTTRVRDTLYQSVPREQVEYRDTTYQAWVSGFRPSLDSIRLYVPVKCVTITEQVPVEVGRRWGLGFTAGYGASVQNGAVVLAPYVGIGISYNLLTW